MGCAEVLMLRYVAVRCGGDVVRLLATSLSCNLDIPDQVYGGHCSCRILARSCATVQACSFATF